MSARMPEWQKRLILEQASREFEEEVALHPERFDPEWLQRYYASKRAGDLLEQRLWERAGIRVSLMDLIEGIPSEDYRRVLPVLLEALHDPEMRPILSGIVRTLIYKEARGIATRPLLDMFKSIQVPSRKERKLTVEEANLEEVKATIAGAMEVLAEPGDVPELLELLRDRRHGWVRGQLIPALLRFKPAGLAQELIELLGDEEVRVQAINGLGRLRVRAALTHLEPFLQHPDKLTRQVAKEAIERIHRAIEKGKAM